jgi:hypothetical protein
LNVNIIGVVGGILAFVSIALPWWTFSVLGLSLDVYLFQLTASGFTVAMDLWFGWMALFFVAIGGLIGIAGSVVNNGKNMLLGCGVLGLLAVGTFAFGMQTQLSSVPGVGIGLISSGPGYSTYLSYGFWLALASAILSLVGYRMRPKELETSTQARA